MTDDHIAKRKVWGAKHKDWTVKEWERVLFSDECSLEKSKDPRTDGVFCTPQEKYLKECIHGVTKGPGIKLMVWSCIWGLNKGPLIPIFAKSVNRLVYREVLEGGLLNAYREALDTLELEPISQQDNAKIHTAVDTIAWLSRKRY